MGRSNFLRISACALMLVDHIGAFLFPHVFELRLIGRLAFPLFAYLIAEGYFYTRDVSRYAFRLVFLASIWQPFHLLFIYLGDLSSLYPFNVLYTLIYGLFLIVLFERYSFIYFFFAVSFALFLDFMSFGFQYGAYGALLVLCSYVLRGRYCILFIAWLVLSALVVSSSILPWPQLFSVLAVLFLIFPFSVQFSFGRFFYWFFPLHILFLMFIKRLPF